MSSGFGREESHLYKIHLRHSSIISIAELVEQGSWTVIQDVDSIKNLTLLAICTTLINSVSLRSDKPSVTGQLGYRHGRL